MLVLTNPVSLPDRGAHLIHWKPMTEILFPIEFNDTMPNLVNFRFIDFTKSGFSSEKFGLKCKLLILSNKISKVRTIENFLHATPLH